MPRKTLRDRQTEQKQKGQKSVSDTDTNRVRLILEGLIGNEDPDNLMMDIISVLK